MAEKNLGFGDRRFLQKNLGFGVGFGYRNNTTAHILFWRYGDSFWLREVISGRAMFLGLGLCISFAVACPEYLLATQDDFIMPNYHLLRIQRRPTLSS